MGSMFPVIPQEGKNDIVKAALDGGINFFDTAEMYGGGLSERSLALALKAAGKSDSEVVVATKWLPFFRTAANIPRTIANRVRFLDGYSISLYMIHQPWSFSSPESEMDAMADLVEAGKIRSVGVSNFSAARMRRAHAELQKRGLPLAVNQVRYSLLRREIETNGVLETAQELGVTIVAYTPLASGLLTGKYHRDPKLLSRPSIRVRLMIRNNLERTRPLVMALEEIAAGHQATAAQVALNWLIHFHGEAVVTIPGATKTSQAQESARAMRFRLSNEEMARLDQLSRAVA
jgi:aryl-alcohol dehydrogenase-like predicted oxidoreductase